MICFLSVVFSISVFKKVIFFLLTKHYCKAQKTDLYRCSECWVMLIQRHRIFTGNKKPTQHVSAKGSNDCIYFTFSLILHKYTIILSVVTTHAFHQRLLQRDVHHGAYTIVYKW